VNLIPSTRQPSGSEAKPEIITIGTVNADILMGPQSSWPTPGTETVLPDSEIREGGGAGNTAIALRALGAQQRMICNIGNDVLGNWLIEKFGPLAADWSTTDISTALTVGFNHPDGERTFFSTAGHCAIFDGDTVDNVLARADLTGVIVLFVGPFLTPALVPSIKGLLVDIKRRGGITALDTAWPTGGWDNETCQYLSMWLPKIDILLLNEAETRGYLGLPPEQSDYDTKKITSMMTENSIFALKRGERGALAVRKNSVPVIADAAPVDVVDTVGAGDCFNAGFLLSYARGGSLEMCLQAGNRTAVAAISSSPRTYASAEAVGITSSINYQA
jgi:sugar/nucleoside kinase (ribokinase family)